MQTTDLSFSKGAKRYPLNKYTNLYPLHNEIGFPYANYLFIYRLFWTQACPEGMCTNGT